LDGCGTNGKQLRSLGELKLPVYEVDRALFTAATRVIVHNRRRAQFWTSSWLDGMSPVVMFPALFKQSKRNNRFVADVVDNDSWIRDIMQDISAVLFIDYIMLWTLVDVAALDLS
jgi:hypothetical protein